ncbi:MAG: trypsin-like peptidase domain-containing protein [Lachnospiraceae bacterium]|nr:trypsin-like peptidase domain-containing protein [Lachnospiraceae bacterium]
MNPDQYSYGNSSYGANPNQTYEPGNGAARAVGTNTSYTATGTAGGAGYTSGNGANPYGRAPQLNSVPDEPKKKKKEKKSGGFFKKALSVVCSGVAFGLAAALVFIGVIKNSGVLTEKDATEEAAIVKEDELKQAELPEATEDAATESHEEAEQINSSTVNAASVSEIAKANLGSVVAITCVSVEEVRTMFGTQKYEGESAGSGIIIGENDGEMLIATNNHVVQNSEEISVCFADNEDLVVEAQVKGTDPDHDLAVVSVNKDDLTQEMKDVITIANLGNSDALTVGDQVVAIGNALGYGQSVTTGIISALNREVTIESSTNANLIQTDAAINPGNSGGALFNMQGELIGINSSKYASTTVEGMGYAIPINEALPILQGLMSRETRSQVAAEDRGYLGITAQSITDEVAEMYGMPEGVYVVETAEGGAAEESGIRKKDIITKFDGTTLTSANDLVKMLEYYSAGDSVEVVVERMDDNGEYREQTITVTLGSEAAKPSSEEESGNAPGKNPSGGQGGNEMPNMDEYFNGENPFQEFFDNFGSYDGQ